MKPIQRYTLVHQRHFESRMVPNSKGDWVSFSDLAKHYMDFVESLCLGWNTQLISGGALNEENSIDESKM